MKTAVACLSALFAFAFIAQPVDAQTRIIRHPAETVQALTVYVPDGWTNTADPDNNLIIAAPTNAIAFSLSLVADEAGYTLDQFARSALDEAKAQAVTPTGEDMIPPFAGSRYAAKMDMNGMSLSLDMVIVKADDGKVASATMITGPQTTAEERAIGEMILRSVRIVR